MATKFCGPERDRVEPEVLSSWERCTKVGLAPGSLTGACFCSRQEFDRLSRENEPAVRVFASHLGPLLGSLPWADACGFLQDENGVILEEAGSGPVKDSLKRVGIKKRAKLIENNLGASAPAICLSTGWSGCVRGDEHYLAALRRFLSIAVPVTTGASSAWGCISLWVPYAPAAEEIIPLALGALACMSRSIRLSWELDNALETAGAALDSVAEAIVQVDANGFITAANRTASEIMGKSRRELSGVRVEETFPALSAGGLWEQKRLCGTLVSGGAPMECEIEVAPAFQYKSKPCGAVLKFRPLSPASPLSLLSPDATGVCCDGVIGVAHSSRKSIHIAKIAAPSRSNILLQGETGTGKEVLARFIHRHSKRRNKTFIPINCPAIPSQLAESELFGYEPGAFTGANPKGQKGKFELADNGTVFLDEINSLDLAIQRKLLRVIESQELMRLGGRNVHAVDLRIIAASSTDLREDVLLGKFLPELLYRINAITINIPPLRERREDIAFLAEHFLDLFQAERKGKKVSLDMEARLALESYEWPGNIRELRNAIEYGLAMSKEEEICVEALPDTVVAKKVSFKTSLLGMRVEGRHREKEIILKAIEQAQGNMALAARVLGISRSTLYRKMRIGLNSG